MRSNGCLIYRWISVRILFFQIIGIIYARSLVNDRWGDFTPTFRTLCRKFFARPAFSLLGSFLHLLSCNPLWYLLEHTCSESSHVPVPWEAWKSKVSAEFWEFPPRKRLLILSHWVKKNSMSTWLLVLRWISSKVEFIDSMDSANKSLELDFSSKNFIRFLSLST